MAEMKLCGRSTVWMTPRRKPLDFTQPKLVLLKQARQDCFTQAVHDFGIQVERKVPLFLSTFQNAANLDNNSATGQNVQPIRIYQYPLDVFWIGGIHFPYSTALSRIELGKRGHTSKAQTPVNPRCRCDP